MITSEEEELLRQNTDPLVIRLLDEHLAITKSQKVNAYLMLYDLIDSWTGEMTENAGSFKILHAEDKIFERALKLAKELPDLIASTEAMVSPEQREEAVSKRKKQPPKTLVLA